MRTHRIKKKKVIGNKKRNKSQEIQTKKECNHQVPSMSPDNNSADGLHLFVQTFSEGSAV